MGEETKRLNSKAARFTQKMTSKEKNRAQIGTSGKTTDQGSVRNEKKETLSITRERGEHAIGEKKKQRRRKREIIAREEKAGRFLSTGRKV